jgi:hypothetical protein
MDVELMLWAINQERRADAMRLRLANGAASAEASAALNLRPPSWAVARRLTMFGGLASLFAVLRRPVRSSRQA